MCKTASQHRRWTVLEIYRCSTRQPLSDSKILPSQQQALQVTHNQARQGGSLAGFVLPKRVFEWRAFLSARRARIFIFRLDPFHAHAGR